MAIHLLWAVVLRTCRLSTASNKRRTGLPSSYFHSLLAYASPHARISIWLSNYNRSVLRHLSAGYNPHNYLISLPLFSWSSPPGYAIKAGCNFSSGGPPQVRVIFPHCLCGRRYVSTVTPFRDTPKSSESSESVHISTTSST